LFCLLCCHDVTIADELLQSITSFSLSLSIQREREVVELQIAEENLKLKEMELQMKSFNIESDMNGIPLEAKFKDSIQHLTQQKQALMDQLRKVCALSATSFPIE